MESVPNEENNVLPAHSCPTCKHYEKNVGEDPCFDCIDHWVNTPASNWEERDD